MKCYYAIAAHGDSSEKFESEMDKVETRISKGLEELDEKIGKL